MGIKGKKRRVVNPRDYLNAPRSKCQECARAVGGCSWSKYFEPVPNWDAEETIVHISYKNGQDHNIGSYMVNNCPLFQADAARHTNTIRSDKVKPFAFKILLSAIGDLAEAIIRYERIGLGEKDPNEKHAPYHTIGMINECEKFLRSPFAGDMFDLCGINISSDRIIEMIRSDPRGTLDRMKIELEDGPETYQQDEYTAEYDARNAERKRHDRNSKKHV